MASNHDQFALVKSNSDSRSTSSGDSKQDVEPVEVSLVNEETLCNTQDSDQTKDAENKPLLNDLNINPHHNTSEECLDCSCDETMLSGNTETEPKVFCRNCTLEKKVRNGIKVEDAIPALEESPDQNIRTNEMGNKDYYMESRLVTDSRDQVESDLMQTDFAETASASNFDVDPADIEPIMTQPLPLTATVSNYCPPGLEDLLDVCQLVVHKANFRKNIDISKTAVAKLEVVDISRKVVLFAEREPPPISSKSFLYKLYNSNQIPVMEVYCPLGKTCVCCSATWHMCKCCKLQAMVSAPPGQIIGFIRREHTRFVQEYHILNPSEELIFILRGGPLDLEIYTPTLGDELGRVAVRNWVGIMREIKRSAQDYGITFPMDLDVRVKATVLGVVFLLDWIFTTRSGCWR